LLKKISGSMDVEVKTPLHFDSEQAHPGKFMIDGLVRIARTTDEVGSPIHINSDLLYSKSKDGLSTATDVPLALSILIHEYGHHQGVKDHARLDQLGTKLQTLVLTHEVRSEFWNGNAALSIFQFNSVHHDLEKKNMNDLDRVVLENRTELYDLTDVITQAFHCPGQKPLKAIRLYNSYSERGTKFDAKTQILNRVMKAWFIANCEDGQEYDHGDLTLGLHFKKLGEENFLYLPEKTDVKFTECKKNPEVCK
jgi:hypothetical protein